MGPPQFKSKNRKSRFSFHLVVAAIIVLSSSTANSQTRIYFGRGATRATARGYLRGIHDEVNFVLRAKAGQHMRVDIRGRGPTRGMVSFPSGGGDGSPGGVVFDGTLPDSGDYRIRVTESSMADAWRGNFTVIVDITTGTADSNQTDYNSDLGSYAGKYPSDLLAGVPSLKTRLRELLGANYASFTSRLQTEMPIEREGEILIARGCMAHQCTIEEAILAMDLTSSKLWVAIKSTRYGGGFKIFAQDKDRVPDALRREMQK
jgi:hypothetical protein